VLGDAWYLFAGALGTLLVSAFWPSIGVLFAELLTTPFTPNPDEVARRRGRAWGVFLATNQSTNGLIRLRGRVSSGAPSS